MIIEARINGSNTLRLVSWDANSFTTKETLSVQSDDLNNIKGIFYDIKNIDIIVNGQTRASYTKYNTFDSITYNGTVFCEGENRFVEAMDVHLKASSLVDKVDALDKKVNNVVDTDSMTLDELKAYVNSQFSEMGQEEIFNGTTITLSNGSSALYTYNLEDQSNILVAVNLINAAQDQSMIIPYHSHNQPCNLYSAIDMLLIFFGLQMHSTEVQTRVNMLLNYVRSLDTKKKVLAVKYEDPLPEEYKIQYDKIMQQSVAIMQKMRDKYVSQAKQSVTTDEE